jgi:lysophospholipase L1-like esterase
MNRIRLIAAGVIALSLAAVGIHAALRHSDRVISDTITRQAPELGPHAHLLLPNLHDAVMVVADRPHDPFEVVAEDRFERLKRLRTFTVTTSSAGLRSPEFGEKTGTRILCVGDSVTFGWGVPYAETYPALLAEKLGVEVINAGVPAMKPSSVAKWVELNAAQIQPDLVLFARRPDWSTPDPWGDFQRSVRAVAAAVSPAKVGVLLPPVSTFDPMGVANMEEERRRAEQLIRPLPLLDLTPAFRAALPLPGVILEIDGGTQRVIRLPERAVVLEAKAPAGGPGQPSLADEVVAMFEDDHDIAEPLFFDGGHPDTAGFVLFTDAVAAWIESQGLLRAAPRAPGAPPR